MTRRRTEEVGELAGGLRTVVNRLAHALRKPLAHSGVTPTRLAALVVLHKRAPMRPGDLAGLLNISAASMSRLTEVLEEGDWIQSDPDPDDRRARLLSLSSHGRDELERLRMESTGELADAISDLDATQREALSAAMPALVALADRLIGAYDDEQRRATVHTVIRGGETTTTPARAHPLSTNSSASPSTTAGSR